MSITGITPLAGVLVSSGLTTSGSQGQPAGGGSAFGPAAVVDGSTPDFTQGLYNSLGALLGTANIRGAAAPSAATSASQDRRAKTVASAAAKIDAGDFKGGRAEAEGLLEKNSADVTALHLIAHSYLGEQNYPKAEQFYARASALNPNSARLKGDLANARSLQKSDDEVLAAARRKLQSPSHRIEALRLLLHLSDRSPNNTEVYLALADGFSASRDPIQVIGALQEAVRVADKSQIEKVITRAKRLAEEHPDVGLTHNILGRALQKAGHVRAAIRELQTATKTAPDNTAYVLDLANAYVARAQAKLESGDVESAGADLQAARSIDPANTGLGEASARVAAHRAGRFIVIGLYNRALGELSKAAAKAPDDVRFKNRVAVLYGQVATHFENQNADAIALSSYRKAYQLNPNSTVARRKVGELSHQEGLSAVSAQNYDSAIIHFERAYDTARSNDSYRKDLANAYDLRGQLRVSQNKLDDAIVDYKKGFALDPSNTSLDANLSAALAQ
ncbi:MAG: hypothetical protein V3W34_17740, partial [Phycisphaerae bacterium]